jgi:hypothetical protein
LWILINENKSLRLCLGVLRGRKKGKVKERKGRKER